MAGARYELVFVKAAWISVTSDDTFFARLLFVSYFSSTSLIRLPSLFLHPLSFDFHCLAWRSGDCYISGVVNSSSSITFSRSGWSRCTAVKIWFIFSGQGAAQVVVCIIGLLLRELVFIGFPQARVNSKRSELPGCLLFSFTVAYRHGQAGQSGSD